MCGAQNVQGDLGYTVCMRCAYTFWTYARAHDRVYVSDMHTTVWTFLNGRFGRTRRAHGLAVCGARLGWARGSEVRGARLRRDTCAHGRVHGSVATHGFVAHGVNFMGMIEPCG